MGCDIVSISYLKFAQFLLVTNNKRRSFKRTAHKLNKSLQNLYLNDLDCEISSVSLAIFIMF